MSVRPAPATRTASEAFREGNSEAVQRVLKEVEVQAEKRVKDGFSQTNFSLGVLNCFLVTFVFATYPQHFWTLFTAEACILFPIKVWLLMEAKPLNQILYLLDYCWVMNTAGVVLIVVIFVGKSLSEAFREHVFLAAYGTAIGPLFGANMILPFIALIFHKVEAMTSVFIHLFPSLLFYTLRWKADEVKEAWPNVFHLDYEIKFWPTDSFTGNVFGNTIILYLIWFVPYSAWIYFIGMDLPRKVRQKKLSNGEPAPAVYDTVFHSNMRQGLCVKAGALVFKRPVEESKKQVASSNFELKDLALYMVLHFLAATASMIIVAYPSYLSKYAHGAFLVIVLFMCTWRGAQRYTYYSTKMYSSIIRKQFADELEEVESSA